MNSDYSGRGTKWRSWRHFIGDNNANWRHYWHQTPKKWRRNFSKFDWRSFLTWRHVIGGNKMAPYVANKMVTRGARYRFFIGAM